MSRDGRAVGQTPSGQRRWAAAAEPMPTGATVQVAWGDRPSGLGRPSEWLGAKGRGAGGDRVRAVVGADYMRVAGARAVARNGS